MKRIVLSLLACIMGAAGYSQYYSTGQDPASLRWRQIKTDRYRLIYPAPFEKKAQYLGNILDIITRNETHTLNARTTRIPVVIHSQSAESNGVTVWAPKRIELYPCAPQQTYPEEWLEQLSIHEYRHAVQISKINRGFSRALYYVFGEQVTGGILGLYVPTWFLEGDATVTETSMTHTGRGRSALFESTLRAQLVEKGKYSFDKATMGSYKTFTPDAYSLGYFLVGQARARYGPGVWNMALDRVAKYPFMAVPFNSGIHKVTGLWKTGLYKQSLTDLGTDWTRQLTETKVTAVHYITKRNLRNFTSYQHPLPLNDTTILADRSSMDDIGRFVLIDRRTGRERRLLTPGPHAGGSITAGGNYLAWSAARADKRWGNREYSVIMIYSFKTGKIRELLHRTRYFAPALSPTGSMVAAVHLSFENQCSIALLAVPGGRLIKSYPIPGYAQASTPQWSPDARRIIFTLLTEKGVSLASMDTASGRIVVLLPWTFNEFSGHVSFFGQYIVYSNDDSGLENIYAMDTATRKVYRVTGSRFAAYDAGFVPGKRQMIFSDYTSDGLMVAEAEADPGNWVPVENGERSDMKLADILAKQELANVQDSVYERHIYKLNTSDSSDLLRDTIGGKVYKTAKYSRFLNLLNPHSWAPASFNVNNLTVMPGVMLLSQNVLSTMFAGAGWEYDINGQTGKFYASLTYQGWYPALTARFDIGNRAAYLTYHGSTEKIRFTWQETNFKTYVSIPFNFSRGKYSRFLQPAVGTTLIGIRHNSSTPEKFTTGIIQSMDYILTASQYLQSNQKDVYPRWGQAINVTYRNTPFGGNDLGSVFGAAVNLYFPGIIRHQGIWLYAGYQDRNENHLPAYSFADLIRYPRGYSGASDQVLYSLGCNYKFPIICPDLSAGSVLYLKRVKMNLFYDWANGNNPGYVNTYQSMGGELTCDFHLLRFIAPIEMGVRCLYYPSTGDVGFEFLYSISY